MTYKQFKAWCNERSCDGCWSMRVVLTCIEVIKIVGKNRPSRREKVWRKINEEFGIEKNIVIPINEKIQAIMTEGEKKSDGKS